MKLLLASLLVLIPLTVHAEYLVNLSANAFDPNSTANPFCPGNPLSPNSFTNPFGIYGSPFSNHSATNPYAPDSIGNRYGRYGSPDSINNPFGAGSPYNPSSTTNPYGRVGTAVSLDVQAAV